MSQARKLILHIGFPKTGSSAIQSWLAKNAAALAQHGIAYLNFRESAADDEITSGNAKNLVEVFRAKGPTFTRAARDLEQGFVASYFGDYDTAIVSGEGLAGAVEPRLEWFRGMCSERHISVAVLGYCRSVYGHCYSAYQQLVKRQGETCTFREFAAEYSNPQCRYIWPWHSVLGGALKIRLYDVARRDLIADFARETGVDHLGLNTDQGNVNRSLSFVELELLRHLNTYHKGVLSGRLSDALIYANPGRESDYWFDPAIAEDFERRFGADVRRVNEVFFPGAPEQLQVSRASDSQHDRPVLPELATTLDPTLDTVLQALCESAAEAKVQERRLRGRLSMVLAKLAVNAGKWDVAAKNLQRAVKIEPNNAEAIDQLSEVYAQLGDHDGAEGLRPRGRRQKLRAQSSGAGAAAAANDWSGDGPAPGESELPAIVPVGMEVDPMSEHERDDAAANLEGRREARRQARNEQSGAGTRAAGAPEGPRLAARKEARDRLAYIRIRLQEIAEERERLVAERTRLLGERKEGQEGE